MFEARRPALSLPTAADMALGHNLSGHTIVVTGGTSGIGLETTRALASTGARMVLGVRDMSAGAKVAEEIECKIGRRPDLLHLDLAELGSVLAFARNVRRDCPGVDILIANAGVSKYPLSHLANGLDVRFACNHLAHFYLAHHLYAPLAKRRGKIIVLSSAAHKGRPVQFGDLQWRVRPHDDLSAYGESKTANILFALEAHRRWSPSGIMVNAVLPGASPTGLQRFHDDATKRKIGFIQPDGSPNPLLRTPAQAAATSVWAATSPMLDGRGGLILEDCAEAVPAEETSHRWLGVDRNVLPPADAQKLWQVSLGLLRDLSMEIDIGVP